MQFDKDTVDLLLSTIKKYGWMDLPSDGISMYPYIKKGNICRFTNFNESTVRQGDILLYYSSTGQLIAHRFLYEKTFPNGKKHFILKGDTNVSNDEPISKEQIIGSLISITNSKKTVYTSNLTSKLWGYSIRFFPILSRVIKYYLTRKIRINLDQVHLYDKR
ncbi:signal peptidase I [Metabacillus litoralis]|uniref:signal peptidase I n=1 Tax=Metabacillus litoralis TaxID=152268 RepID=UPI001CFDE096|nr:signal peptidase I [Metabacillus litoralis]